MLATVFAAVHAALLISLFSEEYNTHLPRKRHRKTNFILPVRGERVVPDGT